MQGYVSKLLGRHQYSTHVPEISCRYYLLRIFRSFVNPISNFMYLHFYIYFYILQILWRNNPDILLFFHSIIKSRELLAAKTFDRRARSEPKIEGLAANHNKFIAFSFEQFHLVFNKIEILQKNGKFEMSEKSRIFITSISTNFWLATISLLDVFISHN